MKDIANKVFTSLMQLPNSPVATSMINQAMPTLEKLLPEKIALLKARAAESQKAVPAAQAQQQRIFDPSSTPEQILSMIPKMTSEMEKSMAYQSLINKLGPITDDARAKRIIDGISDDRMRANAQQQYDVLKANRALQAGKLDDARRQIGGITNKHAQVQQSVSLALQYFKTGKEADVDSAKSLMKDARGLTNEMVDDGDDMNDLMEIIRGYAVIEPETSFRLAESIIDQLNEYVQATAVLSKYEKRSNDFKKGELILRPIGYGGSGVGGYLSRFSPQLQVLGKNDFDRALILADRFQRADSRMIMKLNAVQGFLTEDRRPVSTGGTGSVTAGSGTVIRP
jgi:hypothetical protein